MRAKTSRWYRVPSYVLLAACLFLTAGRCAAADQLPLRRVVIFNSGLGYFEHAGKLEGDAEVELHFAVDEIKDVIKTLVVMDASGQVSVDYDSRQRSPAAPPRIQLNLAANSSLTDLLTQLRGEKVRITTDAVTEGNIVTTEIRKLPMGDKFENLELVVLKTATGLRAVPLYQVLEIAFVDPEVDAQFQHELEELHTPEQPETRTVRIHFRSPQSRQVRVGYLLPTPVWKTSYRAVLGDDHTALLQGWAHVENVSKSDWNDVSLSFVSGNPISFIMDLYDPLFVQRPIVAPPMIAALSPIAHSAAEQMMLGGKRPFVTSIIPPPGGFGGRSGGGFAGGGLNGGGGGGMGGAAMPAGSAAMGGSGGAPAASQESVGQVESAATTAEIGESFRYDIASAVTIPKEQSAMLPIVNQTIPAEKLSIYSGKADLHHPLHGVQLTNNTGLHFIAGPVTVYEAGEYAGDAQIGYVAPDEKRLLSYALDVERKIKVNSQSPSRQLIGIRIVKGQLQLKYEHTLKTEYGVTSSSDSGRTMLIEHPRHEGWTLMEPKQPLERAEDVLRFRITVPGKDGGTLTIVETQQSAIQEALLTLPREQFEQLAREQAGSAEVRKALATVAELRQQLDGFRVPRDQATETYQNISSQQDRIRKNMQTIDRDSELYRKYVKKLTDQEAELDQLAIRLKEIEAQESAVKRQLNELLATLAAK